MNVLLDASDNRQSISLSSKLARPSSSSLLSPEPEAKRCLGGCGSDGCFGFHIFFESKEAIFCFAFWRCSWSCSLAGSLSKASSSLSDSSPEPIDSHVLIRVARPLDPDPGILVVLAVRLLPTLCPSLLSSAPAAMSSAPREGSSAPVLASCR